VVASLYALRISTNVARQQEYEESQRADGQLGAIPAPAGETRVITEWLHWRKLAEADSASGADFSEETKAARQAGKLARALKLTACVRWQGEREPLQG